MRTKHLILVLAAMFAIVSCNNDDNGPQKSKYATAIDNLITESKNLDAATFAQDLPGMWEIDTEVIYDDNWYDVVNWHMFFGEYNNDYIGWSSTKYEFLADGTGLFHYTTCDPTEDNTPRSFNWEYDADNHVLTFVGNYNARYNVVGFNSEYIVLEFYDSINDLNMRKIYKRIAE